MTQEALKLALEFIENSECGTADLEARIKEALAQTQEPKIGCVNHDCDKCKAQRTWVGLDHQDKKKFSSWLDSKTDDEVFTAIDNLLREMNT